MNNKTEMVVNLLKKSKDKNFRILADELTLSEKLKSTSDKITTKVSFILNEASIEFVSKISKTEVSDGLVNAIMERLRGESYIEAEILKELSKARSWRVRKFVAKIVYYDILLEMAKVEEDDDVLNLIIGRLREKVDTEEVKKILEELSNARSWRIRKFVARKAPRYILIEMAKVEEDDDVLDVIIERLRKEANIILKKLSKFSSWKLRKLVAEVAPHDILLEMAKVEYDMDVFDIIIERLRKEVDTKEVNTILKELSENRYWKVRKFVAEIAPCDILLEMVKVEYDSVVLDIIFERLRNEADTEEVKKSVKELSKSVLWNVRKFAAEIAPRDMLVEMEKVEHDTDVLEVINLRLANNYEESDLIEDIKIAEETNDKELRVKLMIKINRVYEIKY